MPWDPPPPLIYALFYIKINDAGASLRIPGGLPPVNRVLITYESGSFKDNALFKIEFLFGLNMYIWTFEFDSSAVNS